MRIESNGKTYLAPINIGTARRVRQQLGIDLLAPEVPLAGDPPTRPLIVSIATSPLLTLEISYHAIAGEKPDIDAWLSGIDTGTVDQVTASLLEELRDFSSARLPTMGPQINAMVAALRGGSGQPETAGAPSGEPPASPASCPTS